MTVGSIWQCPKCSKPLVESLLFWSCEANHSFDKAKQGYINLLLANQKHSSEPGDNAEMMTARREFLNAGFYQPLALAVSQLGLQYLSTEAASKNVLDLGCGEGYYLKNLQDYCRAQSYDARFYGVDISKVAIKKAAKSPEVLWAVASNYSCPVVSQNVDLAICIFAPILFDELRRILSPDGVFLRVSPGPRHFYQLKSALYSQVSLHQKPVLNESFSLVCEKSVQFTIDLNREVDVKNILAMTPLNWHGQEDAKMALIEKGIQDLECDFLVQVLKPLSHKSLT